jgi:hypothetical protein
MSESSIKTRQRYGQGREINDAERIMYKGRKRMNETKDQLGWFYAPLPRDAKLCYSAIVHAGRGPWRGERGKWGMDTRRKN